MKQREAHTGSIHVVNNVIERCLDDVLCLILIHSDSSDPATTLGSQRNAITSVSPADSTGLLGIHLDPYRLAQTHLD